MSGLGCTPAEQKGSLPPSLPPSVFVIGEIRQKFDARPSIQARKIQRHPTPPSCAAWVGFTWQDSPLLRKAFPLVLSWGHWLGVRAWGPGCPNQTRTLHRHQENASSAHPCWVAQLKICSLACGAMPVTEGITPDQKLAQKICFEVVAHAWNVRLRRLARQQQQSTNTVGKCAFFPSVFCCVSQGDLLFRTPM